MVDMGAVASAINNERQIAKLFAKIRAKTSVSWGMISFATDVRVVSFSDIGLHGYRVRIDPAGSFDTRQMTMGPVYRLAMRRDANRLYEVRRRSILELAPPTMPAAEAQAWAERLTLSGMERKLHELEIWVAERGGIVAGWGAIRDDMLEGLYTAPEFAGQGVGAGLLDRLEGLMRERRFPSVRLEASSNAHGFYLRRGYRAIGPQTSDGAWPMAKEYLA
jgi:putative acetyltransferase